MTPPKRKSPFNSGVLIGEDLHSAFENALKYIFYLKEVSLDGLPPPVKLRQFESCRLIRNQEDEGVKSVHR